MLEKLLNLYIKLLGIYMKLLKVYAIQKNKLIQTEIANHANLIWY